MQGIGPGSILGGRYTAGRRTAQHAGAERWTARDTTLDRTVLLFTVPRSHPNVDAVLDAARRTAGLDNARLSRILDVGVDDDIAYVVEESLDGSHSLASLLAAGALPAPEVRRIAGETALVLDLARHRGLHHQRLTPDLVMRTADGDVKVRGLATMAALAGVDDVDDQSAARTDAMAVVAIAYAGFTGHWPLPGDGGGLPPAPRVASHVAAPSEIAVGVPADLDALCRLTFANDQGPLTPGDFARQIAPWSPIPVLLPTLDPPEQSDLSHAGGSARRSFAGDGRSGSDRADGVEGEDGVDRADGGPDGADGGEHAGAGTVAMPATGVAGAVAAGAGAAESPTAPGKAGAPGKGGARGAPGKGGKGGGAVPVARRVPGPPAPAGGGSTHQPGSPGAPRPSGFRPHPASPAQPGVPTKEPTAKPAGPAAAKPAGPVGPGAAKPAGPVGPGAAKPAGPVGAAAAKAAGPAAAKPARPAGPAAAKPAGAAGPAGPSAIAAMTAATTAALGSAGAATASAAKAVSGRLTEWSSATRDRAREAVDDVRARREDAAAARSAERPRPPAQTPSAQTGSTQTGPGHTGPAPSGPHPMGSVAPGVGGYDQDTLDTPVPLLPASTAQPLTREQSRMAIGIVVGFLVIALLLAMWGLQRAIPSIPALSSDTSGPAATGTPTAGATDTGADSDGDGTPDPPAAGAPLTFTAASDYDPLGDGAERPEELPKILDGDDGTAWASEGYRNGTFSGLKPGLGIVLDLGQPSSVSAVTLVLPSRSVGRVYVTDDEGYAGADKPLAEDLAEVGAFDGSGTVTTALAAGASGRYVIVWFTEISNGGEQWFRARLAGASATS